MSDLALFKNEAAWVITELLLTVYQTQSYNSSFLELININLGITTMCHEHTGLMEVAWQ